MCHMKHTHIVFILSYNKKPILSIEYRLQITRYQKKEGYAQCISFLFVCASVSGQFCMGNKISKSPSLLPSVLRGIRNDPVEHFNICFKIR